MQVMARDHATPRQLSDGATARPNYSGVLLHTAVLLVLGAGAIHFAVVRQHLDEYVPFGIFFLLLGAAQVALAIAVLRRPSVRLFAIGASGSLLVVAIWAISRTIGVPVGPDPFQPEDVGLADTICTLMEALAATTFLILMLRQKQSRVRQPLRTALCTIPSLVFVGALTCVGVAAASSAMPVAFNSAPAASDAPSTSVTQLTEPDGPQPVKQFTLVAEVTSIAGKEAWTYNGTLPGPELQVAQGDRVQVMLVNHLPVATSIHWHGIAVPNAMDGVAGITQDAVAPGATYVYSFVARDAGTYWYHPHQDTENQINHGLFGALIVEPSSGHVPEQRDYTIMLHNQPLSNVVAMNGITGDLPLEAQPGETVRLRLINIVEPGMDGGPETPVLLGAPYRVEALDGHDLNQPEVLGPERLPLGISQRADLVFTMPASGSVRLVQAKVKGAPGGLERLIGLLQGIGLVQTPVETQTTATIGAGPLPSSVDADQLPLFDETTYGVPNADPVAAGPFDVTAPVVLGSHPGFHDGALQLMHTINGQASPEVAPISVHEGQLVHLHIVNTTGEYHPMHIHGHVFSVIATNGVPIQGSPLHLDSVLVGPNETVDVAFLANNPGIWMFHCHVLIHAAFGMSTTINYVGVSTPFEMGSRSGNIPE